jgi:hypothetical protein
MNKVIQLPVTTPTPKDNITRNPGGIVIKSNAVITRHISTARKDANIISFLFFIKQDFNDPSYKKKMQW